jgi:diaminopimelate decarboxylase
MDSLTDAVDPWRQQPSVQEMRNVFEQWVSLDAKNDADVIVFQDLDLLAARSQALQTEFQPGSRHHFAIKANPSVGLLRRVLAEGLGLEAASWGEVELAKAAGARGNEIVFDSPAKTIAEIHAAIEMGITLSIDSLSELDRALFVKSRTPPSLLLRVNPEIGLGRISYVSVAGSGSRFGIPISRLQEMPGSQLSRIAHSIAGVHYHLGSQGVDLTMHEKAFVKIARFAGRLSEFKSDGNEMVINVGGGAPATMGERSVDFTPRDLAKMIEESTKALANNGFPIFTEFGRAIVADGGWCVSRVEYVSVEGRRLVSHVGADMFLRVAYRPEDWSHQISLLPREGDRGPVLEVGSDEQAWEVFGPLCFAGDKVGTLRSTIDPTPGDRVLIHNVGAYTLSLWSRHCNRPRPGLIGYSAPTPGAPYRFEELTHPEQPEDIVAYWS